MASECSTWHNCKHGVPIWPPIPPDVRSTPAKPWHSSKFSDARLATCVAPNMVPMPYTPQHLGDCSTWHTMPVALRPVVYGKAPCLFAGHSRDGNPSACGQGMLLRRTGSHDNSPGADQVRADTEEKSDVSDTSRDHSVKAIRKIVDARLKPFGNDPSICQRQLPHRGQQERRPALSRLHHRQIERWGHDLDRYTGDAGAGTEIKEISDVWR